MPLVRRGEGETICGRVYRRQVHTLHLYSAVQSCSCVPRRQRPTTASREQHEVFLRKRNGGLHDPLDPTCMGSNINLPVHACPHLAMHERLGQNAASNKLHAE